MIRSAKVGDTQSLFSGHGAAREVRLHIPTGEEAILLPDESFLLQGEYARDGYDLLITNRAGETIRIEGYFALAHPPLLALSNGAALGFETVKALALSDMGPVLAAGPAVPTGGEAGPVIGKVEVMAGSVQARGTDGVTRTLKEGDPIQKGDQVTTGEKSLAKFVMQDGTVFQVGESARALVDNFVYQPEESKGQFAATVLTGTFRYASGQLAQLHGGKHTLIKTPTAEIGVRGSELLGEVVSDGSTTVVHNAGILEISDILGKGVVTLLKPGTATAVHLGAGAPLPVFQAPDALLKHLESQVSDQAINRAREIERQNPDHNLHPDGNKPGDPLTLPGEQSGNVIVDPDKKPVEIAWKDLQSAVKQGGSYAVAESTLAAVTKLDVNSLSFSPNGISFILDNMLFSLGKTELIVTRVNHAPVLPIVTGQTVQEKSGFSLQLGAWSDPDGDAVTLSAHRLGGDALPNWLKFDATTGLFAGTPGSGDVGQVTIDLLAKDSLSATSHQVFTISVANVNDPPMVSRSVVGGVPLAERTVLLAKVSGEYLPQLPDGRSFSFQVPAGTFTDPDLGVDPGEKLTLAAMLVDDLGNVQSWPSWMQFDAASGVLTVNGVTPANTGSYNLKVTATDVAGKSASDTFLVNVRTADSPYVLVEQGFFVDAPVEGLAYASGGMTGTTDANGGFYYRPGDKITFTLGGLVLGEVTMGEVADSSVTLTPLTLATSSGQTNQNIVSNLLRLLQTLDSDGDPSNGITISAATISHAAGLQIDLSLPTEQFANNDQLKSFLTQEQITSLVSEDVARQHFQKTLDEGIGSTFSALPRMLATQDHLFHTLLPQGMFVDPNGETLTFAATLADGTPLPGWLKFSGGSLDFSGTPDAYDVGTRIIRLSATNTIGQTTAKDFELVVKNINDAPHLGSLPGTLTALTGRVFEYALPGTLITDADVVMNTGDKLTVTAAQADGNPLPDWLTFDGESRTFSGVAPDAMENQTLALRLLVKDLANAQAGGDFSVTFRSPLAAPVAGTVPEQQATEKSFFTYTLPAGTFSDPGDTLSYTAAMAGGGALPGWLTFHESTLTFSGKPDQGDVVDLALKVTAKDSVGLTTAVDFSLKVINVNDAPVVSGTMVDQEIHGGKGFLIGLPRDLFHDPDSGDQLTLAATLQDGAALPEWLKFDPSSAAFAGNAPDSLEAGYGVRVTATDRSGVGVSTDFNLTLTPTNHYPAMTGTLPVWTIREETPFTFILPHDLFTDADAGQTITLKADLADGSPLPSWLHFDGATGHFTGTLADYFSNLLAIRLTATDSQGGGGAAVFSVTMENVNDAPILVHLVENGFAIQDRFFTRSLLDAFTDVDPGDHLVAEVVKSDGSALPSWLQYDATTWTLFGTPTVEDVGKLFNLKVTAKDLAGADRSDLFLLLVTPPNEPPQLTTSLTDQLATQGQPFLFRVTDNT
ncbi:MAG: putative Ig domain-containing protein, partial [Magnetococcales bacterium]|nr:putative Ig domain-containing protein [Magnetococcales bacterium]